MKVDKASSAIRALGIGAKVVDGNLWCWVPNHVAGPNGSAANIGVKSEDDGLVSDGTVAIVVMGLLQQLTKGWEDGFFAGLVERSTSSEA